MGLHDDERVARTTAVRFVNDYIKQNSLQNASKRSEILLDDKLRDLLCPSDDTPVTYFSLSKLLVQHFPKAAAGAAVAVAQQQQQA
jgi:chromatin remodeling complex protein RSC6